MNTAANILGVILIFLSGGLLGYSITNYHHTHEEIRDEVFILSMTLDLKVNHPEVYNEIRNKEYFQKWMNEK